MGNYAKFMLLSGAGHSYGGEGIVVEDILFQHMGKGGWFADKIDVPYWTNDSIDDAMLMISIYFVAPKCPNAEPLVNLRKSAEELFKVPLSQHGIDTTDKKHISHENLQELYQENQQALANSLIKIVAVNLFDNDLGRSLKKKEFLDAAERYGLTNYEYCETISASYFGEFDKEPRKHP